MQGVYDPKCISIKGGVSSTSLQEFYVYIYGIYIKLKGVHENRTKGVENKVDDTLKLVVFLECAQC